VTEETEQAPAEEPSSEAQVAEQPAQPSRYQRIRTALRRYFTGD
jgi:hypothetical protein